MYIGQFFKCDSANGIGIRASLFVSGCRNRCKGCFQPETWDFHYGIPFTTELENEIYKEVTKPYYHGLSVLGGEPMEPENQPDLLPLFRKLKTNHPDKTIWVYSGYTWEELTNPENTKCHTAVTDELLSLTDVLVDGKFEENNKSLSLRFRGSSNQRIINVQQTLKTGRIILSEYMN